MPDAPSIATLVDAVVKATAAGKLQWKESSSNSYDAQIQEQGKIRISRENDGNLYYFTILSNDGKAIESVNDEDAPLNDAFTIFGDLYDGARNQARGISTAIRGMLDALR